MNNLEKKLSGMPKPKLSFKADLKIKSKLYYFIISKKLNEDLNLNLPSYNLIQYSLAVALIIIVIFGGTSIYAYTNSNITPGQKLYQLKRAVENVEKDLAITHAMKVAVYEKLSNRRLEEAVNLSKNNSNSLPPEKQAEKTVNINKSIDDAMENFNHVIDTAKSVNNTTTVENITNNLKKDESSKIDYLSKIEQNANFQKEADVISKVKKAKDTINKYRALMNENENKFIPSGSATTTPDVSEKRSAKEKRINKSYPASIKRNNNFGNAATTSPQYKIIENKKLKNDRIRESTSSEPNINNFPNYQGTKINNNINNIKDNIVQKFEDLKKNMRINKNQYNGKKQDQ